ncbi:hypothetical protein SD457_06505 [Coprobacillaceae bacterium CR2/5/TPMF4]|nr:hypothetical protein SD457_06505 [Coprobacillaceae bacterium CR2/5/TPMF4]
MHTLKDLWYLFKNERDRINICDPLLGDTYLFDYYKNLNIKLYENYKVISIKNTVNGLKIYIKK